LQESEAFLFNTLKDQSFQSSSTTVAPKPELVSPTPSVYLLPKRPVRFYGRGDILAEISTKLNTLKSMTISGKAGVGKTSIALQYAYQSLSKYKIILWMRSEPTTALDQGCVDALIRLGVVKEGTKPGVENRQKWTDYLSQSGPLFASRQETLKKSINDT
jgi:hypothetical protein